MNRAPRTRIAPSPTGIAHVGTLYMALFDYAIARQNNGQFIIRIEDTDRVRFVEGAEEVIYESLHWAGLTEDESPLVGGPYAPYRQSERLEIYQQYAQQLIDGGHAYYCFCTADDLAQMRAEQQKQKLPPKYDGRCRNIDPADAQRRVDTGAQHVVRLKVPAGETTWDDLVRGSITIDHAQIDEQVLIKSDGFPTYHMAVVIDDHLMGITHIIRGEEWISSTPKHMILYSLFGWEQPVFAHMPLLRNADHSKLSKRKNDVSIMSYRDQGYLPEALRNFLMLMGWSHPEGKEFISLEEFVKVFSFDRVQTTGPIFDVDKLRWMNGKYIREHLTEDELIERLQPFLPEDCTQEMARKILPLVRERLVTLRDWEPLTTFFYRDIQPSKELLLKKLESSEAAEYLSKTLEVLNDLSDWTVENLETNIRALQEQHDWHKSKFFMLLRVAVTGETATPPLFETMEVLGQEVVLKRLAQALNIVSA